MTWVGGGIALPAVALSHFLPTPNPDQLQIKKVYPIPNASNASFLSIYIQPHHTITNLNNMPIHHLLRHKRPSKKNR
jgi:hypothetical protein